MSLREANRQVVPPCSLVCLHFGSRLPLIVRVLELHLESVLVPAFRIRLKLRAIWDCGWVAVVLLEEIIHVHVLCVQACRGWLCPQLQSDRPVEVEGLLLHNSVRHCSNLTMQTRRDAGPTCFGP